jgi:hypothetical protein
VRATVPKRKEKEGLVQERRQESRADKGTGKGGLTMQKDEVGAAQHCS